MVTDHRRGILNFAPSGEVMRAAFQLSVQGTFGVKQRVPWSEEEACLQRLRRG